jgi:hypothetical protein
MRAEPVCRSPSLLTTARVRVSTLRMTVAVVADGQSLRSGAGGAWRMQSAVTTAAEGLLRIPKFVKHVGHH